MARLAVPLAVFTLSFLVLRVAAAISRRRRLRLSAQPTRSSLLVHSINDDRCTGCEACVRVCPTDVLELTANRARPVRFDDCIQCNQCEWVCPTRALVMHPPQEPPPPIRLPALDEFYQTNLRGLYLIGEAAGKPLTKNASNLGRAVIEHMRAGGLRSGALAGGVDVLIIGSGPGGLSAALTCIQHGYSYLCIEKDVLPFATVARYPVGKWVMAEPYDVRNLGMLPIWDAPRDDLVRAWRELIERSGVKIALEEVVQSFRGREGDFAVQTSKRAVRAQRVVVAVGTRGKPRKLGVPGETLPTVVHLLGNPDDYRGRRVLVVGGGDSAAEAACALVRSGARVTLSYRGKQIVRANPRNREQLLRCIAEQRVRALWSSRVKAIRPREVAIELEDGSVVEQQNDAVITLIGADPPMEWLQKLGVACVERPHLHAQPRTDELVERLLGPVAETTADRVLELLSRRALRVIPARVIPLRPDTQKPASNIFDAPTRAVKMAEILAAAGLRRARARTPAGQAIDLSRAAREARARAHAKGEISVDPSEQKTAPACHRAAEQSVITRKT